MMFQVIAEYDAASSMVFDRYNLVWAWVPIPYYEGSFYYATSSVTKGLHTLKSAGFYTVFVRGINDGAGYGFVPAYNGNKLKILKRIC